jgi:hypothetical protein
VDCRQESDHRKRGDEEPALTAVVAIARNGTAQMSDRTITRARAESIGGPSRRRTAQPHREQYADTAMPACASVMPRRVSASPARTSRNYRVNVRSTTMK